MRLILTYLNDSIHSPADYSWKDAFLWGNFVRHCKKAREGNLSNRIVHTLFAIAEFLPIIGQIASIFEKTMVTIFSEKNNRNDLPRKQFAPIKDYPKKNLPTKIEINEPIIDSPSVILMKQFWEQHIHTFKISHGTTSLYYNHFKQHGISATYPLALEGIIEKIRHIWRMHEDDIVPRTGYFTNFEERYDQARLRGEIRFSFSADESITEEYTTGARQGGEWIREVKYFLASASRKNNVISNYRLEDLLETEALIDVMSQIPAMIVSIRAGDPALRYSFGDSLLCPLGDFIYKVKKRFNEWEDPEKLENFLNNKLLHGVDWDKRRIKSLYEIGLYNKVDPASLEFEFVTPCGEKISKLIDSPKIDLDKPSMFKGLICSDGNERN